MPYKDRHVWGTFRYSGICLKLPESPLFFRLRRAIMHIPQRSLGPAWKRHGRKVHNNDEDDDNDDDVLTFAQFPWNLAQQVDGAESRSEYPNFCSSSSGSSSSSSNSSKLTVAAFLRRLVFCFDFSPFRTAPHFPTQMTRTWNWCR